MKKTLFKNIVGLLALIPISSGASESCAEFESFIMSNPNHVQVCDSANDALFVYDSVHKAPSLAIYRVLTVPYEQHVINRGSYDAIPEIELDKQRAPSEYNNTPFDKAYLVAPYMFVKKQRHVRDTFNMRNILPIEKPVWRGALRDTLFQIDQLERDMFKKRGDTLAIYGTGFDASSSAELSSPQYLYRVYLQQQYQQSIAFLIPVQSEISDASAYITSVDCIEETVGIDLLAGIEEVAQADIENDQAASLGTWARRDGNYEGATCGLSD